uniref:Putative secreted protein n=1 Tax=Anopheles darlingi TaxID=43151 RepID=A0A2M4D4P2_ANODA
MCAVWTSKYEFLCVFAVGLSTAHFLLLFTFLKSVLCRMRLVLELDKLIWKLIENTKKKARVENDILPSWSGSGLSD